MAFDNDGKKKKGRGVYKYFSALRLRRLSIPTPSPREFVENFWQELVH